MQNAHADTKKMHRQFDEALEDLAKLDAGSYLGDPDQPMSEFHTILNSTASNPIANEDQLRILRKGVEYLRVEAGAPHGSIEKAMEAAMQEAIDTAPDALQGALLALVRHQLRGQRIDPLPALDDPEACRASDGTGQPLEGRPVRRSASPPDETGATGQRNTRRPRLRRHQRA